MDELLIMNKRILLNESPILYNRPLTEQALEEDWVIKNAQWICRDKAFWGKNPIAAPGVVYTRKTFPGNVLVDFCAQTVLPSTHDINVMWAMSWDEDKNQRGAAYVAGIQGWWDGKVGIEKSPDYQLIAGTSCSWFLPGKEYHIQAGSIDGHCFIFVDDVLRLEMLDPHPIDTATHNQVGFEAYQSMIKISNPVIRQIKWEPRPQSYKVEF